MINYKNQLNAFHHHFTANYCFSLGPGSKKTIEKWRAV
jgi:hypothetical protein